MRRAAATMLVGVCWSAAAAGCLGRARPPAVPHLFPLSTVWTSALGQVIEPPLAAEGKLLFVSTSDGGLRALETANGNLRWEVKAGPGLLAAGAGILVLRERDGTVWGLEAASGSTTWTTRTGVAGALPPVVADGIVVVAGEGIAALDPANGRPLWGSSEGSASAPPVVAGERILVGEADGTLRCRDRRNGNTLWTYATGGPLLAEPVVDVEGRVLLGTTERQFLALRLLDGKRRWRWKVGADVQTPPAVQRGRVLFASHEAVLYALADGGGDLVWRAPLPSRPISGPLLFDGALLVACYGTRPEENLILGFTVREGEKLGDMRTPAELRGRPLAAGGRLFLPLRDRRVIAMRVAGVRSLTTPESP